jgi:hypothetical protein
LAADVGCDSASSLASVCRDEKAMTGMHVVENELNPH